MSNTKNNKNNSQATDQQELIVLEKNYQVSSVINYHIDHIVDELKDLTSHFFNLGYHLFKLKESWDDNLTKSDFYKFCEKNFLLKSTSIKNFINVYKAFKSKDDEDELDERFEGFSFTALVELLPLADDKEFAKNFKLLSTREIKEIVSIEKDSSVKDKLLKQVYEVIRDSLRKKDVDVILADDIQDNEVEFVISAKNSSHEVHLCLSVRNVVGYYGQVEDEVFYLRSTKYISSFSFWSKCFSVSDIEEVVNELEKSIKEYAKIHVDDEPSKPVKEKFIPTGAAFRLNLKKKDIVKYALDKEHFTKTVIDIPQLDLKILALEGCDYIFGVKHKPHNQYDDGFRVVDSTLSFITNSEIESLMLKE